ncbi:MAG: hypothetical protein B7Y80_06270 [Hyphomicrobium sp. 32-62-53]|nr:MAG: hypothetical protein B7Z29_12000 [Hyphomicrobium sp. 12-62-95]OYY00826.1 MAG: hypothetical protein B7Y80_06270 [Hyphomicrobium sp. 32-62-53]
MHTLPTNPRSLACPNQVAHRISLLNAPHVLPLTEFTNSLRKGDVDVPYFDPFDGGINACILFLFEKPGPMTATGRGSGFISRDNDDPTAEATFRFMKQAGIERQQSIIWNVMPSWNGSIRTTALELRHGLEHLDGLLALLKCVRTCVLVGAKAQRAHDYLSERGLKVVVSAHPSMRVKARWRLRWEEIPAVWAKAKRLPS